VVVLRGLFLIREVVRSMRCLINILIHDVLFFFHFDPLVVFNQKHKVIVDDCVHLFLKPIADHEVLYQMGQACWIVLRFSHNDVASFVWGNDYGELRNNRSFSNWLVGYMSLSSSRHCFGIT
jgi:hypothetical protein